MLPNSFILAVYTSYEGPNSTNQNGRRFGLYYLTGSWKETASLLYRYCDVYWSK